ncbi:MAG: hypothetical protein K2O49_06260 [Muribaculaceae bacterium]|nr:hypothetical protein [Muribaculaceae bacterium]
MSSPVFIIRIVLVSLMLMSAYAARAQKFKVESFRILTNDVTAFVHPVSDLNDEGCALIKVQASPDFEFSTPLGIVKRVNKTGEIWLYIPKGSKKITLKHPEWGVLRDYTFPEKIESHISYELRLDEPERERISSVSSPVVTTVHDTLVVTRTDTMLVTPAKKFIPLSFTAVATALWGGSSNTLSGGIMLALMKRHGGFMHIASDFGSLGATEGTCDRDGYIGGRLPYYSGKTRHSFLVATGGAIQRLSGKVSIFEGIGYGYDDAAWQLAQSEGGGVVKNSHYCHKGIAFEAGAVFSLKKMAISASVASIGGKQWYAAIGVGINLKKRQRR